MFAEIDSATNSDYFENNEHRWLCENLGFLHSALASLADAKVALTSTEYVRCSGQVAPRVLVIAEDLLASLDYRFSDSEFSSYLQALQDMLCCAWMNCGQ